MFEILQHTADVRLRVRSASIEELFLDAMRGMFAIMNATRDGDRIVTARIALDAIDRTTLLVDFLSAILSRAHIEHAAFEEVSFVFLAETDVAAHVTGHAARFEQDVKAVTYHEADLRQVGGGWETTLVFDI